MTVPFITNPTWLKKRIDWAKQKKEDMNMIRIMIICRDVEGW